MSFVSINNPRKVGLRIIWHIKLKLLEDTLIGDGPSGLSVEVRKRVTIGVELAAKLEILLYLDEPTSGLDNQSAVCIVRFLRKLADNGSTIICTIHQPSAALFGAFDQLLLLDKGRTIFHGPVPSLRSYLLANGARPSAECNIAEFTLQMLGDSHSEARDHVRAGKWATSFEAQELQHSIDRFDEQRTNNVRLPMTVML